MPAVGAERGIFTDPEDGAFDASEWLLDRRGLLPVPIIITEPAIGYGGPCFPRDNKAFSALGRSLGVNTALAEATDQINSHQVQRLLGAVEARAKREATVAVLGLSYKPHTGVVEESQGVQLASALAQLGFRVVVSDPMALPAAQAMLSAATSISFEPDARAAIEGAVERPM